jgi:hypothetical protein
MGGNLPHLIWVRTGLSRLTKMPIIVRRSMFIPVFDSARHPYGICVVDEMDCPLMGFCLPDMMFIVRARGFQRVVCHAR